MQNKNFALILFGIALILFSCSIGIMMVAAGGGAEEFIYALALIAPFAGILFCIVGLAQSFQKPSETTDKNAAEQDVPKSEEQTVAETDQISVENKAEDEAHHSDQSEK